MCTVSKKDAHDVEKVKEGFPINRTMDSIHEKFEALKVMGEDGEWFIPKHSGDYEERQGLTARPITELDVVSDFSVLHSWLRGLYFCEQLAYRINAGVYKWGQKKTDDEKASLIFHKKEFVDKSKDVLGMQLDMPKPKGGSTDTGPQQKSSFQMN